jgi:ribonuclease Z
MNIFSSFPIPTQAAMAQQVTDQARVTLTPKLPRMLDGTVLGGPADDNALWVTLDTGEKTTRLLFDCGAGCLDQIRVRDIQQIDAIFFSHFHFDHVAGFDSLIRHNFARERPLSIFGPSGSAKIIQNRFCGYLWDLVDETKGRVQITEILPDGLHSFELKSEEAFSVLHEVETTDFRNTIIDTAEFSVEAVILDHGRSPSIGYLVKQKPRVNIDPERLTQSGLPPGRWLQQVTDLSSPESANIEIAGQTYCISNLRQDLLVSTPGESIGYLTDFKLTQATQGEIVRLFKNCSTLVCENNYRDEDATLAGKNNHMTSSGVGRLAREVDPDQLVVFHLTPKYKVEGWKKLMREVRAHFPRAGFPPEWAATFGENP